MHITVKQSNLLTKPVQMPENVAQICFIWKLQTFSGASQKACSCGDLRRAADEAIWMDLFNFVGHCIAARYNCTGDHTHRFKLGFQHSLFQNTVIENNPQIF